MLGRLLWVPERRRTAVAAEQIAGLPLLRGILYAPEGLPRWRLTRRIRKLRRLFEERGIRRLIVPEDFPFPEEFSEFARVDPLPFYRSMADLLALKRLELSGLAPARSVVALSGPRLCSELTGAAQRLCPLVRGLVIDVPGEGARYADMLHRTYGLPVDLAVRADVTVAFGPGGERRGMVLKLGGEGVDLCGMELTAPELILPPSCERQLLAALWEYGGLGREKLLVVPLSGRETTP